ncbi:MAG: HEAT repeat domain-containing protein [Haloarculaceae archaeon]
MATEITAFGYAVPLVVVVVALALVVGLALATAFYLTVGWSVYRSVADDRRERVRDDLEDALLDRLFDPDADWDEWVAGLSGLERDVVESLLDEYLRELDGADADRLRGLGEALGIPDRARRRLEGGDEFDRLHALTWLTLLRRSEPFRAAAFEPETARERATAARLLYECDALDGAGEGVSILLDDVDEALPVFGQDTLYRIAREEPGPLLAAADDDHSEWPTEVLTQVLAVCRYLDTSVESADLSWLTAALEADNEAVRANAARALGSFGWRAATRDGVFLDRATADPSPRVRAAVYEMLGAWGDDAAVALLADALATEEDPRALTRGTDALVERRDRVGDRGTDRLRTAWGWSREHARFDALARRGAERVGE